MLPIAIVSSSNANILPGIVRNLTGYQTNTDVGSLEWQRPLNNGGSTVTSYRVIGVSDNYIPGFSDFDSIVTVTGDPEYVGITINQHNAQIWTYTVFAINGVGQGTGTSIGGIQFGIWS